MAVRHSNPEMQLPRNWRQRVASYRGATRIYHRRVLAGLAKLDWMPQDHKERAAFVIVEKERLRQRTGRRRSALAIAQAS